jgi:spore germination protein YaaH
MSLQRLRFAARAIVALVAISSFAPANAAAVAPATKLAASAAHSGPHREIFGFGLASSLADPTVGYPSWDFSLLSTVAFFGIHVQPNGYFVADSGWTVWNSPDLTGLLSTAHAAGTKVVLTIILQDFSPGTPNMCSGLAQMDATVAQTVSEVRAKGVDGVNIDYEGLNGNCGTPDPSWARHQLTGFAAKLRSALPPGSYLSVDTYGSSAVDSLNFFDIAGLAASVDSFFVMAYDLEYSNYQRPPLACSGFCLGPTAPLAAYYYNDTTISNQYLAVVAPSKVILGVPYYGRKACVASPGPNGSPNPASTVAADTYLDASTEAAAPEVQPGSYVAHRDANDPAGQERWDTWFNTTLNCTRELYWDDTTSLGHKYDLVVTDNLRGVGIWNLNYGGGAPELWQELNLKFGTPTPWYSLGGLLTSSPAASSSGANATDAFARGTDNGLWHRSWNGTVWSPWSSLGGTLIADPSAVSQAANHIDVFVVGTDHGIWHRAWNGSVWSAWDGVGGYATSAPAVSSWGSGRLDLVVRGTDNGLWHRSWNGTSWSAWDKVGGVVTSNPTIVSWGTGRVDVFVRGTDNALWHRAGDGAGAWSVWESQGGYITSGPASASCALGHLDVYATGADGGLFQKGFNGAWQPWAPLHGLWTAGPQAVCPAGTTGVDVFERGPDYALWESAVPGS